MKEQEVRVTSPEAREITERAGSAKLNSNSNSFITSFFPSLDMINNDSSLAIEETDKVYALPSSFDSIVTDFSIINGLVSPDKLLLILIVFSSEIFIKVI